ncbi:branched-chain amino acid ABC transporter ATPase [Mycobacterium tuberculosis]|nr:branched-chain amino acid ABC transporter ATPase [Mycobacterium tuberculosis]
MAVSELSAAPAGQVEPAVLRASGLYAGYGDITVVRNAGLEVSAGEIVAILGPNGAGKSTTLLTLAGVLPPHGGRIEWQGAEMTGPLHKRAAAGLGLVPEERSVIFSMTVRDNLLLGAESTESACAIFPELRKLLDRRAGLLSGGEQQMLTLARALSREPTVLLADELSLGLGPMVVDRLFEAIQEAARTVGTGVMLVEQQAKRALKVADRWYLMRRGEVVASGEAEGALDEVQRLYLAEHDASVK